MARRERDRGESSRSPAVTTHSDRSDSERSYTTAPTEYSTRPTLPRVETCLGRIESPREAHVASLLEPKHARPQTARDSAVTYASTSEEDVDNEEDDLQEYAVPQDFDNTSISTAIPTTPRDFADLFPTSKRLSIRHDDTTIDGNMNLRIDTQVEGRDRRKQDYTLFHLRMHDLRTREFSLRRYCRESGREVCHSIRKYQQPPSEKPPVLQRASTALANLRHKSDSRPSTSAGLKRSDSGYESIRCMQAEINDPEDDSRPKATGYARGRALMPTNTIKLEFSNYAHLDVKRRGAQQHKKYTFEYWGHDYSWKRIVAKDNTKSVSYYLVRSNNTLEPLAHISPIQLTPEQAFEESARGGWIPPCYIRITDERILNSNTDISDIVVATGLMALVDDCIKRKFHTKQPSSIQIPLVGNKLHIDYVGPKRLIDELFNRPTHVGHST